MHHSKPGEPGEHYATYLAIKGDEAPSLPVHFVAVQHSEIWEALEKLPYLSSQLHQSARERLQV